MRGIALTALATGVAVTGGELTACLGGLTRVQRRELIDQVRVELGLPSSGAVEADRRGTRIGTSGLGDFPVLDRELPPPLRAMGLGGG